MLYAGAALMIGAGIYGFVDYKQTHNKKEFKEMYSEEKKPAPVAETLKQEIKAAEPEKTVIVKAKPVVKEKKAVIKEEAIRPIEPIAEEDLMVVEKKDLTEKPVVSKVPAKESSLTKPVKKKKVRKEFFSRGRMPEVEVLIEKPAKKEEVKTESREL